MRKIFSVLRTTRNINDDLLGCVRADRGLKSASAENVNDVQEQRSEHGNFLMKRFSYDR